MRNLERIGVAQRFARPAFLREVFEFSGQSSLETWSIRDVLRVQGWSGYDAYLSHEPELCFQRIRQLVDEFPTWQHQPWTGRRQTDERVVLVGLLVRQFLRASFRQTESMLRLLKEFFRLAKAPDHNTLSLHNRSLRLARVWRRFHRFVLERLPERKVVISTDSTGFSTRKRIWSQNDYGLRATQSGWMKTTAAVEVPQLLYLNSAPSDADVHDSNMVGPAWSEFPDNVRPIRSLADGAFANQPCLEVAQAHGATPLHDPRKNARHRKYPGTSFEKLVNFATHWPNRFRHLVRLRKLVETTFHVTKQRFGDRLWCRSKIGRENEIQARQTAHYVRVIIARELVAPIPSF